MTFAELRTLAQRLYKESVNERTTLDQTIAEMTGIYTPEHILKEKERLEAHFAESMKARATELRESIEKLLAEKREDLDRLILTPPSAEQTELLNTVRLRGASVSKDEYQRIAQQFGSNYQALNALSAIGTEYGVHVNIPAKYDFQVRADNLNWAESYLAERAHGLEHFKTPRQAHPFDRLFFGEGWQDNFYQSRVIEVFDE